MGKFEKWVNDHDEALAEAVSWVGTGLMVGALGGAAYLFVRASRKTPVAYGFTTGQDGSILVHKLLANGMLGTTQYYAPPTF